MSGHNQCHVRTAPQNVKDTLLQAISVAGLSQQKCEKTKDSCHTLSHPTLADHLNVEPSRMKNSASQPTMYRRPGPMIDERQKKESVSSSFHKGHQGVCEMAVEALLREPCCAAGAPSVSGPHRQAQGCRFPSCCVNGSSLSLHLSSACQVLPKKPIFR